MIDDILMDLLDIARRFDPSRSSCRSYLASIIYNRQKDKDRKEKRFAKTLSLDGLSAEDCADVEKIPLVLIGSSCCPAFRYRFTLAKRFVKNTSIFPPRSGVKAKNIPCFCATCIILSIILRDFYVYLS